MDEDWDWDRDEVLDLDGYGEATGDPQLDVYGYQSPKQRGGTGFTSSQPDRDWLGQSRRDYAERQRKRDRQRQREEAHRRREASPSQSVAPIVRGGCYPRVMQQVTPPPTGGIEGWPVAPPVTPPPNGPLPGQHGAYFEVRTKRVWWAPWRKKRVWQQISAWHMGLPPAGTTVVTVSDVAALPGTVHTIGAVGESGAVEY